MRVEIDKQSGFCFGVVKAIEKAEEVLTSDKNMYCLGDIVHNNVEVSRLNNLGLVTIDYDKFKKLKNCKVLIRAHGEPPETYETAKQNNIELIDATCPVVLGLQKKIKTACEAFDTDGQIVIYGKKGHAEVIGLEGQTENTAIVVKELKDLDLIDYNQPIKLFSQTTMPVDGFETIKNEIKRRISNPSLLKEFKSNNSICAHVSRRGPNLKEFASKHDIVIFVSGKKSSNGRVLYEVCKSANPKSYFISDTDELDKNWFINVSSVGVCGATSTPMWLMGKVAKEISDIG